MIDIRLPKVNATDTEGQIRQIMSYMYQMVEQLNWALNTLEKNAGRQEESVNDLLARLEALEKGGSDNGE